MKISIAITRKVLFEKFHIKHEMRDFLLSRIEGCEIKYLKKYPDSTFFVKNDKYMFEQNFKNGIFWVRYDVVWSIFESKYKLSYKQIQAFITDMLEGQLRMGEFTPLRYFAIWASLLEGQLRMGEFTPLASSDNGSLLLEGQLMERLTPPRVSVLHPIQLENQLKMEELTPCQRHPQTQTALENQLKMEELTPQASRLRSGVTLEDPLKMEEFTPAVQLMGTTLELDIQLLNLVSKP